MGNFICFYCPSKSDAVVSDKCHDFNYKVPPRSPGGEVAEKLTYGVQPFDLASETTTKGGISMNVSKSCRVNKTTERRVNPKQNGDIAKAVKDGRGKAMSGNGLETGWTSTSDMELDENVKLATNENKGRARKVESK